MNRPRIVLKFGSSVLRTPADLPRAVHEVFRFVRAGFGVVAVVSAFEGVTDRLLEQARALGADPPFDLGTEGLATLAASGEREAAASLQIALARAGIPGSVLDPLSARLKVDGDGLEGSPVALNKHAFSRALDSGQVLVVPGFFGMNHQGSVSLLGRGGSDWTALFIAQRLGARCRLLKDTDGIYEWDPQNTRDAPRRFEYLNLEDALALRAAVVQERALRFALSHSRTFEVACVGSISGTNVGPGSTRVSPSRGRETQRSPLRVTLLGFGTVGRGVYEHLMRETERFKLVAIAVRRRGRHKETAPLELLYSLHHALDVPTDVVVEAMGGVQDAEQALTRALRAGRHVVTANKAVIAAHGRALRALAEEADVCLLASASVGGVTPVIETLRRLREPVTRIEGVLNGTSNFVLDRIAQGMSLGEAIVEAQSLGYAESDPTDDLSGSDAARKLAVLAWEAFGVSLPVDAIPIPGVEAFHEWAQSHRGETGRMVASIRRTRGGCEAKVEIVAVGAEHPLQRCRGAENAVTVTLRNGGVIRLRGRGAGRWPTAESVMGDLFELSRSAARGDSTSRLRRDEASLSVEREMCSDVRLAVPAGRAVSFVRPDLGTVAAV